MPYTSHPSAPIIIVNRIVESSFIKLDIIIKVAAKYDTPVSAIPSNIKYAAIVFTIKKSTTILSKQI